MLEVKTCESYAAFYRGIDYEQKIKGNKKCAVCLVCYVEKVVQDT